MLEIQQRLVYNSSGHTLYPWYPCLLYCSICYCYDDCRVQTSIKFQVHCFSAISQKTGIGCVLCNQGRQSVLGGGLFGGLQRP